jgi:hypothetical protein
LGVIDRDKKSRLFLLTPRHRSAWWPVLVSSEPVTESVRRSCLSLGVVLCDPERFPLPSLLHIAAKPSADLYVSEELLSEIVRLGEPLCCSMQRRWRIDSAEGVIKLALDEPGAGAIGDLLFVQDQLSAAVRDYFDTHRPGQLERRGTELGNRLTASARVW